MQNPYRILGVDQTATDSEIHTAYLEKVRKFPPERAEKEFLKIKEAYEELKNKKCRIAHFLFRLWEKPPEIQLDIPEKGRKKLSYDQIIDIL